VADEHVPQRLGHPLLDRIVPCGRKFPERWVVQVRHL
jgi:hypothetical protein